MNAAIERENTSSPLDRCTVVVIYDDPFMRARALSACDYLVGQLWENVELDFSWWRTDFLNDSNMAQAAAHYAVTADFLIVCSTGVDEPSNTLQIWFESWIRKREKSEGALVDLSPTPDSAHKSTPLQRVLHDFAKRGGLDYLTTIATQLMDRNPVEKKLSSTRPASTDRLKGYTRPPSRFGLNE